MCRKHHQVSQLAKTLISGLFCLAPGSTWIRDFRDGRKRDDEYNTDDPGHLPLLCAASPAIRLDWRNCDHRNKERFKVKMLHFFNISFFIFFYHWTKQLCFDKASFFSFFKIEGDANLWYSFFLFFSFFFSFFFFFFLFLPLLRFPSLLVVVWFLWLTTGYLWRARPEDSVHTPKGSFCAARWRCPACSHPQPLCAPCWTSPDSTCTCRVVTCAPPSTTLSTSPCSRPPTP